MIRRAFWIALGASVGVLAVRQLTKTAGKLSPSGLARSAGSFGDIARGFADDVRDAMRDREYELYQALGIDTGDRRDVPEIGGR